MHDNLPLAEHSEFVDAGLPMLGEAADRAGQRLLDGFEFIWLAVMPITSVLVVPRIQGTTPGALCAGLAFMILVISRTRKSDRALCTLAWAVGAFALLQCASAFAATQLPGGLERLLTFTNADRHGSGFLSTVATQSAYLLVGIVTALYARAFADRRWQGWIFVGPILLVTYGLYEWLYYLRFQESGDFLSNRTFINDLDEDVASGSLVQATEPLGFPVLRLKSLTGEPSMFALATLPYFFLALCLNRRWIALFLLGGLVLSTSSTALLVLPCGLALWLLVQRPSWQVSWNALAMGTAVAFVSLGVISFLPLERLMEYFISGLSEKLSGQGVSGEERLGSHQQCEEFLLNAPGLIQLFGIGFGVARPFSFLDWLLINCGVVGTISWLGIFLWPVIRLPTTNALNNGVRLGLVAALLAMLAGVPEFSYLPTWLFLGLAYARLDGEANVR